MRLGSLHKKRGLMLEKATKHGLVKAQKCQNSDKLSSVLIPTPSGPSLGLSTELMTKQMFVVDESRFGIICDKLDIPMIHSG